MLPNLIFMQGREHLQKRFPNVLKKNLSFIYYSTNIYDAPTTCKGLSEVLILHLWFYLLSQSSSRGIMSLILRWEKIKA